MIIQRSEPFEIDLQHQFRWYLLETELDPAPALELAQQIADCVEETLEFLGESPSVGRRRLSSFSNLTGLRSWKLQKPFERFLIFYRVENDVLNVVRLLDGHRRLAAD